MQKYFLWSLLLLSSRGLAQSIAIMPERMNTLYVGVDNPLHAVVSDVPQARLLLIPSHGAITRNAAGGYNWRLCAFDSSRAWLVLADSVRENALDTVFFRVKRLPEPEFKLGKGQRGIGGIFSHDAAADWKCEMVSFEAEFLHRKSDPVLLINHGARFDAGVSEHVNRVVPGDRVIFTNFKWKVAGCDPAVYHSDQILEFRIR